MGKLKNLVKYGTTYEPNEVLQARFDETKKNDEKTFRTADEFDVYVDHNGETGNFRVDYEVNYTHTKFKLFVDIDYTDREGKNHKPLAFIYTGSFEDPFYHDNNPFELPKKLAEDCPWKGDFTWLDGDLLIEKIEEKYGPVISPRIAQKNQKQTKESEEIKDYDWYAKKLFESEEYKTFAQYAMDLLGGDVAVNVQRVN